MSIKLGKKLTGLALCLALSAAGVYANTLSEVQINAADSGYAIVLKTDSEARMKKVISSPDKMYIELKDVQASDELNTVYNKFCLKMQKPHLRRFSPKKNLLN